MGTDLREPRFLSWDGKLFLYFAVLGQDPLAFEPQKMMGLEKAAAGWTTPVDVYLPKFIPWRTRTVGGTSYMMAYIGGENIYENDREALEIHFLTTADGWTWTPVVSGQAAVQTGGGSETDWAFLDDGSLVAVTRNEAGDTFGWGSKICRASAGSLGDWTCAADPRKYDSPLVFRHGADVYLLARRNVTETGDYDLGLDEYEPGEQTRRYLLDYSQRPKRCALWKVDPTSLGVSHIVDLPSQGDTCFPGLIEGALPDTYVVYNYSSPLDGEDLPWITAQTGPTNIYRLELTF
jgi:hypothetical protein